jgi:peptidoglycan/xylan/chitin deacetylase (PgdA/CDA1 family)
MKRIVPILLGLAMLVTFGATIHQWEAAKTVPVQNQQNTESPQGSAGTGARPAGTDMRTDTGDSGKSASPQNPQPKPGGSNPSGGNTSTLPPANAGDTGAGAPEDTQPDSVARVVYLTFDDGPDPASTAQIMNILDQYGIKGTFFVVGTRIELYPEVLKEIAAKGHVIGNHTYNHKYEEIYASTDAFMASLKKNDELIFQVTGVYPTIVRDPGGRFLGNAAMHSFIAERGYKLFEWNVDSYDSRNPIPSKDQIVKNVMTQMANQRLWPSAIILFHDSRKHKSTIEALPQIIENLKKEGFEFRTLE